MANIEMSDFKTTQKVGALTAETIERIHQECAGKSHGWHKAATIGGHIIFWSGVGWAAGGPIGGAAGLVGGAVDGVTTVESRNARNAYYDKCVDENIRKWQR